MPKIRQKKLLRSSYKEGKFYFWDRDIPKKELCAVISLETIQKGLKHHGNSNWVLYDNCRYAYGVAIKNWIENTKDETLRQRRKKLWEESPIISGILLDEAVRELKKQAEKHNIDLRSWFEKRGGS